MMRLWFAGLAALLVFAPPVRSQIATDDVVRVRLLGGRAAAEAVVEPVDGYATLYVDGLEVVGVAPGEPVTLVRSGGQVEARFVGTSAAGRSVRVEADRLRLRSGRAVREYAGAVEARVDGPRLELVNHTPLEPYVASVVQSEFGFDELEGAKAQAVLARTYAVRRRGATPTYDLDDDQSAQVYRGVDAARATSRRAADETAGQILTYLGQPAEATYFSSSGGHTADNEAVWDGAPVPYLRGVPDPYDSVSPHHGWRTTAARSTVLAELSRRYGGSVRGFEVEARSRSGRVRTVRLIGANRATISGSQLRRAVDAAAGARTVRSTKFEVSVEGDRYVFRGGGYGHGVGMSQFGALGQARAGRTYRQILAHYFLGTEVSGGRALPTATAPVSEPLASGTPSAAVPREPSALRTRYAPPTARRWPTPRRIVREPEAEAEPPAERASTPPAAVPDTPDRRRRTAW